MLPILEDQLTWSQLVWSYPTIVSRLYVHTLKLKLYYFKLKNDFFKSLNYSTAINFEASFDCESFDWDVSNDCESSSSNITLPSTCKSSNIISSISLNFNYTLFESSTYSTVINTKDLADCESDYLKISHHRKSALNTTIFVETLQLRQILQSYFSTYSHLHCLSMMSSADCSAQSLQILLEQFISVPTSVFQSHLVSLYLKMFLSWHINSVISVILDQSCIFQIQSFRRILAVYCLVDMSEFFQPLIQLASFSIWYNLPNCLTSALCRFSSLSYPQISIGSNFSHSSSTQ